MNRFQIQASSEALGYLDEIAHEMVILFPITLDEAIGRINRAFSTRSFETEVEISVLLHEEQDVWAKHIYFGKESCWWLGEDGLEPLPYP